MIADDDNYAFYKRKDLFERNIANGDADLFRLVRDEGFPEGEKTGPSLRSNRVWRRSEVHAWLDARRERMAAFKEARRAESARIQAGRRPRSKLAAE